VSEEVLREKRNAQQVVELEQQRSVLQSELSLSQSRVSELTGIVEATETALHHVREASEQASKASAERYILFFSQSKSSVSKTLHD
jgi:hypothetical protein